MTERGRNREGQKRQIERERRRSEKQRDRKSDTMRETSRPRDIQKDR